MMKIEQTNALVMRINEIQLTPETADSLKEKFLPFYTLAGSWEKKAGTLVVTDAAQVEEMAQAREARLALKDIRVNVEKARKELKEDSLRKGKAIDNIAGMIKGLIEPIEAHLEQQEKFVEIQEAARRRALQKERAEQLLPYGANPEFYNLADMPEAGFVQLLEASRTAYNQKQIDDAQAIKDKEEAARADAAERDRLRVENERLRNEAAARSARDAAPADGDDQAPRPEPQQIPWESEAEALQAWVKSFSIPEIEFNDIEIDNTAETIKNKFTAFKQWAYSQTKK
jgi:hypothetical protein